MSRASQKRLVIGTAGHIDHGKTSLVKALTGTDTDRLSEEKRRGMSIELGFARWSLSENLEIDLIDVPGHEKLIGTMTSGANSIDAALLVISVEDGVMPQTREHLRVLEYLGVRSLITVISKCDLADDEILEWQQDELSRFFETQTIQPIASIAVSAQTGHGLDQLADSVLKLAKTLERPRIEAPLLAIDRAFNLPGKGRIIAGTLRSGQIEKDSSVGVYRQTTDLSASHSVKGLHRHGSEYESIEGPARVALTLRGNKELKSLQRGDWLSVEPLIYTSCVLVSLVTTMDTREVPKAGIFHCGTFTRQVVIKASKLVSGGYAILEFDQPCWLKGGLRFILRQQSKLGLETIGGGEIAVAQQPKCKGVYGALSRLNENQSDKTILDFIGLGARVESLTRNTIESRFNLASTRLLNRALKTNDYRDLKTKDGEISPASHLRDAQSAVIKLIEAELKARPEATGLPESVVYSKLSRWSRPALQHALKLAIERHRIARHQGLLRLKAAAETTTKVESNAFHKVKTLLREQGPTPPTVPELANSLRLNVQDVRDVIQRLHHHREVVKLAPDLYADATVAEALVPRVVSAFTTRETLSAAELKPFLADGISRKWAIPWLEYLDKNKVTVRRGNLRSLHPSRED